MKKTFREWLGEKDLKTISKWSAQLQGADRIIPIDGEQAPQVQHRVLMEHLLYLQDEGWENTPAEAQALRGVIARQVLMLLETGNSKLMKGLWGDGAIETDNDTITDFIIDVLKGVK